MKTINTAKLETMGLAKARAACLIHAEKALTYQKQPGKQHLFERHCDLLDQCAEIGRKLNGSINKPTAREAIAATEPTFGVTAAEAWEHGAVHAV
jgi:hypothetical protein